jgi:hypothetical protein
VGEWKAGKEGEREGGAQGGRRRRVGGAEHAVSANGTQQVTFGSADWLRARGQVYVSV